MTDAIVVLWLCFHTFDGELLERRESGLQLLRFLFSDPGQFGVNWRQY